ncbi:MAG: NUDIX domain-containing protein [Candidatus Sungbacteria bacterium]|uniref:NUDIX domain-containing protein n=1 Tax=Candidatus Sungiibacteriota bacterium TaxID=2750080 RepID=A0A9D6LSH0_9BACT|nr:NUDIX domain-containing protein [Candidatus Sungbacteria bacterium]
MTAQTTVTALILERDGKVLVGRRASGSLQGKWELPGCKLEKGDLDPEAGLRRCLFVPPAVFCINLILSSS